MPALSFKKQFAAKVESGEKRQTIRAMRKDHRDVAPGQTLHLYTGMRTKACRKLGEATCTTSEPIGIGTDGMVLLGCDEGIRKLTGPEVEDLARADGFDRVDDFLNFFQTTHGLPFYGMLIQW